MPVITSITIDEPYQLPDGGWTCLVWRGQNAFPCSANSQPVAVAIASKMARALALHISEEDVLIEVVQALVELRLK